MWERFTRGQDIKWIVRKYGFLGTLRWLRRSAPYYLWLHFTPSGHRELAFDEVHGIETDGILPRWKMGNVGPNLQHAVQYLPTKPRKFHKLLKTLKVKYSEFTFIDIGSGKGRVLILASNYPFKKIIGVEFVASLCEIAQKNIEFARCQAEIRCMDAAEFSFPDEALLIYMCNPFDGVLMEKIVDHLERSLKQSPREIYVIYWNAFCHEPLTESQLFSRIAFRRDEFAVYRSRIDN